MKAADQLDSPYLTAAVAIGDQLVRTAIPGSPGVTWEGDDVLGDDSRSMSIVRGDVGAHLYGGGAGIAWFLSHLAARTGNERMAAVAIAAMRTALAWATSKEGAQAPSLFSGATGVALAAVEIGEVLKHSALRQSGLRLANHISATLIDQPDSTRETDLLGGLAGILVGLLAIHRHSPSAAMLAACTHAADRLVERARRNGFGASWPDHADTQAGLCGLGHGASGVAWALAELTWATEDERWRPMLDEALRYERGWYSADRCAWPDLRQQPSAAGDEEVEAWTDAWCHGAFGIGALRWRLYEATRDLTALADATAAVQAARRSVAHASTALRQSAVSDVTLCHGLGGAIELILLAHEISGRHEHLQAARRGGDLCLSIHRANQNRWPMGIGQAETVPGLFLGLAGIGVTMMRLHDAGSVGSPLLPGRRGLPRKQAQ
jgi:class II lanthipeptide synthase